MAITILGLGPGDSHSLTLEARAVLDQARAVLVRTRQHPTVAALPPHLKIESLDRLYETHEQFEAIYAAIADEVARGHPEDVIYAVPGHPLFGETSVTRILAQARERSIPVRSSPG